VGAEQDHSPGRLRVINLWGGPGCGKSTTAAGLFNLMKNRGHKVELVTEYAKDLTYDRDQGGLADQLSILAQQNRRLSRLRGQVEWAITDSPLPLSLVYLKDEALAVPLCDLAYRLMAADEHYHVKVRRVKPYQRFGRSQSEQEAQLLDAAIYAMLGAYVRAPPCAAWSDVDGDAHAPYNIYDSFVLLSAEATNAGQGGGASGHG